MVSCVPPSLRPAIHIMSNDQPEQASPTLIRSKPRLRGSRHPGRGEDRAQPLFNDPLYEYLDNEVHNREQHNFGPWVEHDHKSRDRMRDTVKVQRNLPCLTPALSPIPCPQLETPVLYQQTQIGPSRPLPPLQRTSRVSSLQELRGVYIQLQPPHPADEGIRKEKFLRKPSYFRKNGSLELGVRREQELGWKSRFNYNYCLREEEAERVVSLKLGSREQPYLRLQEQEAQRHEGRSSVANQDLMRQLRQHRRNKLK